jgi:hypothetical protein
LNEVHRCHIALPVPYTIRSIITDCRRPGSVPDISTRYIVDCVVLDGKVGVPGGVVNFDASATAASPIPDCVVLDGNMLGPIRDENACPVRRRDLGILDIDA